MKFFKQFSVILGISFLGEVLHYLIPLPIPASIYGIVILFLGLEMRMIHLDEVQETGLPFGCTGQPQIAGPSFSGRSVPPCIPPSGLSTHSP